MPRDRCWHPRLRCSKATRSPQIKMTISANQVENWHWCGRTWAAARRAEISVAQAGWRCRKSPGVPRGEWRNGDLGTVGLFSTLLLLGHAWAGVSHGVTVASSAICACLFALNALGGQSSSFFFFLFSSVLHLSVESPEATRGFWGSVRVVRISVFLVKGKQATEMLSDNLHRPVTESFQTSWAASILSWSLLLLSPTGIC